MHELSLALSVVNIVEKRALLVHANRVKSITLEIGECAGVEQKALDFAWPLAVKGSVLEGAERIVNNINGKALCDHCQCGFDIHRVYDPCPNCGAYGHSIMKGNEFRVKSLTII